MTLPHFRAHAAVPQHWPMRLKIVKAARTLVAQVAEEEERRRQAELAATRRDCELAIEAVREACREIAGVLQTELRKAGFNPSEPRVPAGNLDGGQWTRDGARYATGDSGDRTRTNVTGEHSSHISSSDIPANDPKHPVALLDNSSRQITDDGGKPLVRPANLPPEMFIQAGLKMKETFFGSTRRGAPMLALASLISQLSRFKQNGQWDAERYEGKYVPEYEDYATIAIGCSRLFDAVLPCRAECLRAPVFDPRWTEGSALPVVVGTASS